MHQLEDLILGALQGHQNKQRSQSQRKLIQLRESNPSQFLVECSKIITNDSKSSFLRQSSAAVLGRSAITKNIKGITYWDFVSPQQKNEIRNNIINTLVSNDNLILNAGANCLSQVASLEISRGNWLDLIDIFAENVQHIDYQVRKASILSIGYICQQLKSINAHINQLSCQQLLGSIIIGLRDKQNVQIVETAHKALRNSIIFLTPILKQKNIRDQIFKIIITNINQTNKDSRVSYQSLYQFIKACYQYLQDYLVQLVNISQNHLQRRNDYTIMNLQLWDTIGQQYIERVKQNNMRIQQQQNFNIIIPNYIQNVNDRLLPTIIKCFMIYNTDDLQNIQMRQSAIKTLGTIVQLSNDNGIIDSITFVISSIITSSNIGEKQASALIFSSLCQSKNQQYVKNCFINGFEHLFRLLSDSEHIVVKNTLIGFKRLIQIFPQVIVWHKNYKQIVEKFLFLMQNTDNDLKLEVISILCFISQGLTKDNNKSSLLAVDLEFFFKSIVEIHSQNYRRFNENFKEGNERIILIILNLIMATNRGDIIIHLINFSIDKYYEIKGILIQDHESLCGSYLSIIHTSLLALKCNIPQEPCMSKICELVNIHINKYGVERQGLLIISSLVITFNMRFKSRIEQFFGYVLHALQMPANFLNFKTALSTIGDFARVYSKHFIKKSLDVLKRLFIYLNDNIGLEQKIQILRCFGDLILSLKQAAEEYLQQILNICNDSFEAVYTMQKDPNRRDLAEDLKEALIDMYTCMVFSFNNAQGCNITLFHHFPHLANFVIETCNPRLNPTISYLKECLFLIYDSANFYISNTMNSQNNERISQILNSQQIRRLIGIMEKVRANSDFLEIIKIKNNIDNKLNIRR